jgi:hypothetical protein
MTTITSRPQVVQIETQVGPLLDGHLMVRMKVAFAAVVSVAKLVEHLICGWVTEVSLPKHPDDVRLPAAIDTAPAVAFEAEDPQPAMTRIVSALCAGTATFVMFTLSRAPVLLAGSTGRLVRGSRESSRAGVSSSAVPRPDKPCLTFQMLI